MAIDSAGTETWFNNSFKIEIDPEKTEFLEKLNASETSSIFLVNYHGEPRVLKAFHNNGDRGYADDGRDLNRYRCEVRAYCNLKRYGICDGGYVPQFYGFMLAINPTNFAPHLDAFRGDSGFPRAILIQYLPNPLLMNCVTYSEERMQKAVIGIKQIHSALIDHNDPYPKNILIVPGEPERVVWIDFDVAIVYSDDSQVGEKEREWIEIKTEVVESYGVMLAEDQKKGLPPNTKFY